MQHANHHAGDNAQRYTTESDGCERKPQMLRQIPGGFDRTARSEDEKHRVKEYDADDVVRTGQGERRIGHRAFRLVFLEHEQSRSRRRGDGGGRKKNRHDEMFGVGISARGHQRNQGAAHEHRHQNPDDFGQADLEHAPTGRTYPGAFKYTSDRKQDQTQRQISDGLERFGSGLQLRAPGCDIHTVRHRRE